MPTPFFADLVRELCQEGGTGPLTPSGAVPGHRRFTDVVPADVSFHYAVAGIGQPGQWETGLGHIDSGGRLVRDTVAASSAGGARVDFAVGLKTIALTVGAGWFAASAAAQAALDAGVTALAGQVGAKQPLSTTHAQVAAGAAGDLVTVARGSGWVNVPLSTLPFQNGAGRHEFSGTLSAPGGSATAPAVSFTGDLDTGLFRPGANTLAFAVGGSQVAQIASNGNMGLGTADAAVRLQVKSAGELLRLETADARGGGANFISFFDPTGRKGYAGYIQDSMVLINELNGELQLGTANSSYWNIDVSGHWRPTYDNASDFGSASHRGRTAYFATGAINTSDARDKRWRGPATDAELAAARRIVAELGFYQWNDAIAAKGEAEARCHYGVRAQAVWDIMADEGLCPPSSAAPCDQPYAFLCHDEWHDEVSGETRDRYGVRPDQLALFLIAAQEARLAALEAAA